MGRISFASKNVSVETVEKGTVVPDSPLSPTRPPEEIVMEQPEWRATEKSLVRKLDMSLLPVVWTLYMFNFLDRNNLAQAKLNGFEKHLGLVGNQFNTAVSVLNVGYMTAQLPSNMLITRVIYILSCWYTQKELAFRTAILYSGMLVATAFAGLIAAAVFAHLDGVRGLEGWQWLFIIEGAGSFASAFTALAFLPDYIGSKTGVCSWLMSEEELRVAKMRMDADRVSVPEEKGTVWHGLRLAVTDIKTWGFVCLNVFFLSCHGLTSFFPTIVQGFKLGSNTIALVLTAPPYLLAAVVSIGVAMSSDRRGERGLHIVAPLCVAMIGYIITASTINSPVRYFASFLFVPGAFAPTGLIFSWAASTLSATPEKRAAATALVCLLAQLGGIWGPYFFRPQDSPRYLLAFCLMLMFSCLTVGMVFVMRLALSRENGKIVGEAEGTGRRVRLYML
uniref:Major facilitator superfamily transporter n=1 Tax=Colletotrichum fructicola (strain Nara gc5) TaxID=1213859 RepID=L2GHV2_COLFN